MKSWPIDLSGIGKSRRAGQFGRSAFLLRVAGATAGAVLLGAGCSQAPAAQNATAQNAAAAAATSGGVALSPARGATTSTPGWSTTAACPTGFQGSGIFRAITRTGATYSISGGTNSVTAPFKGTLLANLATIQGLSGVPDGGTQELVIICFSGPSLTGTSHREMDMFLTYSADGHTYTTSATRP